MVGHHVSFLEAHVLQAERDHGAFSQALRRWLGSSGLPSFRNVSISPPPASSQTPERGEGLRKWEFKGHVSLPQTGNGGWLAGPGGCSVSVPPWGTSSRSELGASVLWPLAYSPTIYLLSACGLLSTVVHLGLLK